MKSLQTVVKELLYDKELVSNIKAKAIDKNLLYTHLISGKITLQEYISLA